jgi:hypothetical protein
MTTGGVRSRLQGGFGNTHCPKSAIASVTCKLVCGLEMLASSNTFRPTGYFNSIYYKSRQCYFLLKMIRRLNDCFTQLCTAWWWGQLRSKHVALDVLQHYCYSKELCAFVGLNCGNFLICLFGTDSSCLSPAARNSPFSFQKPFAMGSVCCR